jgi:hypothetical protein
VHWGLLLEPKMIETRVFSLHLKEANAEYAKLQ